MQGLLLGDKMQFDIDERQEARYDLPCVVCGDRVGICSCTRSGS